MSRLLETHLLPAYARAPVTFVEGDGCWLIDDNGERYLDFVAGIAVVALGHRHPASTRAAHEQLDLLWHTSNLYWTAPMVSLASRLSERFGGGQSFFCNSGAEAIEAAIKYARKATGKPGIVALEGSFHGRTMGSLSITGQPGKQHAFQPLVPGVRFAGLNDIGGLEAAVSDETGLIVIEPVQGEGGIRPASDEFLLAARAIAHEVGALLCFDEVQTGIGRTGSFFAFEPSGVKPDLVTLAKGLANGLPIGALLVADEAASGFEPGDHASTFGGNPVACAAAVSVLDAIDDELLANVREMGGSLRHGLAELPGVVEVRGRGLLIGAELDRPAAEVVSRALDHKLLVSVAGPQVLRLTPPLTVSRPLVEQALSILSEVLAP
ncbi:MAG: aspartate aminotransferase family protein [Gaiellaceae bacterium]